MCWGSEDLSFEIDLSYLKGVLKKMTIREHGKPGKANVIFNKTVEIILVFHHLTGC